MAVAGDRILTPENEGYATYEITDETIANGRKQAARLVKIVGDDGATLNPAAPALPTGAATNAGAASINAGQATAVAASAELVAARATRRGVTVRNTDASASCYIGEGTVTSANGFLLKAGESIAIYTTAAINGIRATTDVVVCFIEEYD